MDGIFLATGPGLPAGIRIDEISVVDVYPLMLKILDLPAPDYLEVARSELAALLEDDK